MESNCGTTRHSSEQLLHRDVPKSAEKKIHGVLLSYYYARRGRETEARGILNRLLCTAIRHSRPGDCLLNHTKSYLLNDT